MRMFSNQLNRPLGRRLRTPSGLPPSDIRAADLEWQQRATIMDLYISTSDVKHGSERYTIPIMIHTDITPQTIYIERGRQSVTKMQGLVEESVKAH